MTIKEFLFSGGILLLYALFLAALYISDRIKEAKIRRQFSKFEYHQEYEKPSKPWGIYIIGVLVALFFVYSILSRLDGFLSDIYSNGYEAGYEAGIEEGINRVLNDPGAYFDWSNQEVTPMPADTLPKIAAAYIRVSTDDQVEFSLGQKWKAALGIQSGSGF